MLSKTKLNKKELRYMSLIIAIIIIQAVRYFPFKFGGWNQIQLSFNYSYGFIQRAFLGTVLDIISNLFHIPWGYMRYLYGIFTMLTFSVLMVGILYKSIITTRDNQSLQNFFMGMGILFFMGPGWNTHYSNFALTDVWMIILSIAGVYAIIKGKHIWVALILSFLCILIHTAYVFLYFNFILMAYAYKTFISEKKFNKKYLCWSILTFVLNSSMFIYMMFFSHAKEGVTIEHVMQRTAEFVNKSVEEISHHEATISGYLFRNGNVSGLQLEIAYWWLILVVMIILFTPFIYEVYRYWKSVVCYAKSTQNTRAWVYICIPLGIITAAPIYIMHNDYGRWTYAVFFYEFATIWLLNLIKDKNITHATNELMERININKLYYIVLLFYATILGAFEQNTISPLIATIESYCWKIIDFF